jgi:hypothetical protein
MADKLAERIVERAHSLRSSRGLWESHWEDLAELLRPVRTGFNGDRAAGDKRTEEIFDGTPLQAVRGLAATIDWLLKSRDADWFSIVPVDEYLSDDHDARLWLEEVERRMYGAMYVGDARFQQATGEVDLDLVTFGTGVLFWDVRPTHLRFRACALKHTLIAEDDAGKVDTVYRRIDWTVRQAEARFGRDKLSDDLRRKAEADDPKARDEMVTFWHAVEPRRERDPSRADNRNMPFRSVYVEDATKHIVDEGGYIEFPYVVPRWETADGEVYGRSPGMLALPDARTLNEMSRTNLHAAHLALEPPLFAPSSGIVGATQIYPGSLTYYDPTVAAKLGGRNPIYPLDTGMRLPWAKEMETERREMVQAAFFRNVLQLPVDAPTMTATEVIHRKEEFIRALGPIFGRLESDYTAPIVSGVFAAMMRRGLFPPPPDVLQGREIRFEFESPVHKARKLMESAALQESIAMLEPLIMADPSMIDHYDTDKIAREVPVNRGVPSDWLRAPAAVAGRREQRAAQMQAQQEAATALEAAKAAPNATRAMRDVAEMGA